MFFIFFEWATSNQPVSICCLLFQVVCHRFLKAERLPFLVLQDACNVCDFLFALQKTNHSTIKLLIAFAFQIFIEGFISD